MKILERPPVRVLKASPIGLSGASRATESERMRRQLRLASAVRDRQKILIVEDNLDLTMALGIRMRDQGFSVVCAAGSSEAIRVAAEQRPDAIVLDLGLRDGTGFDVMSAVRNVAAMAGTPIFVVSGWDEHDYGPLAQEFEIARYFAKPIDSGVLVRAIRAVLDN